MRLLKTKDVLQITGIGSRSSLWRAVRQGNFPQPKVLSANRICWIETEIEEWAKALPTRSYSNVKPSIASGLMKVRLRASASREGSK